MGGARARSARGANKSRTIPLWVDFSFGYFSAEITRRLHECVDEGGFVREHDDLAILSQLDETFGDS